MPERVRHHLSEEAPLDASPGAKNSKQQQESDRHIAVSFDSSRSRKPTHSSTEKLNINSFPQSGVFAAPIFEDLPHGQSSQTLAAEKDGANLNPVSKLRASVRVPPDHGSSSKLGNKAKSLLSARQALPIWPHRDEICRALREKDVLLLIGETGSGKSTQIPQFLIGEAWCKPRLVQCVTNDDSGGMLKVGGCIAVTEPRRVAAISLARRVAEEMGTPLGSSSPASQVGYSVRFDNSTSSSTRIKFLTEGMLLQEMLRDPWLRQYSAVIVDEVHERGVNVDLLMGFLRNMVSNSPKERGGVPLKIAVMSATADMEGLSAFFEENFQVRKDIDEESEWSGLSSDHEDDSSKRIADQNAENQILSDPEKRKSPHIAKCHVEGHQYPVDILYSPNFVLDFVDAALHTIFQIHYEEPLPGDILVFLTGQEAVESLETLVKDYALGMGREVPRLLVMPLFAALPPLTQQRVFIPTPSKTRKVILATNIAETSVTISGVRFVIDCGKAKFKQFRTRLGLDSLLVKPISKSAAIQRKGRAGREAPGKCYRLYTRQEYLALPKSNIPEILRCDLSGSILMLKAQGIRNINDFPFLDRPKHESLYRALLQLDRLKAFEESGEISRTGIQIAQLPLTPCLGRVLLAAAEPDINCLLEVIDIISCLSVENVFLNMTSEEQREEAETARRELYRTEGDHLTLLATVQAYAAENSDRKAWTDKYFISHRAMRAIMDIRKQLRAQSLRLNLVASENNLVYAPLSMERAALIMKCFLKGFASNTARLCSDGSYKTMPTKQPVSIHPASVMFGKRVEAIMFTEFVFTNRSYARGVSAIQLDWIDTA